MRLPHLKFPSPKKTHFPHRPPIQQNADTQNFLPRNWQDEMPLTFDEFSLQPSHNNQCNFFKAPNSSSRPLQFCRPFPSFAFHKTSFFLQPQGKGDCSLRAFLFFARFFGEVCGQRLTAREHNFQPTIPAWKLSPHPNPGNAPAGKLRRHHLSPANHRKPIPRAS